jgi:hypothetical protein
VRGSRYTCKWSGRSCTSDSARRNWTSGAAGSGDTNSRRRCRPRRSFQTRLQWAPCRLLPKSSHPSSRRSSLSYCRPNSRRSNPSSCRPSNCSRRYRRSRSFRRPSLSCTRRRRRGMPKWKRGSAGDGPLDHRMEAKRASRVPGIPWVKTLQSRATYRFEFGTGGHKAR